MTEKDEGKRILEEAIKFEVDGRDFFLKAVEKAKSYFAKVIFKTIAEDELRHIEKVKEIYNGLKTYEKQVSSSAVSEKKSLQNIFEEAKKQLESKIAIDADELEAIRLAIDLEFKGHQFYERWAREAKNPFEKAFCEELAKEELGHFSVLRETERVLAESSAFG